MKSVTLVDLQRHVAARVSKRYVRYAKNAETIHVEGVIHTHMHNDGVSLCTVHANTSIATLPRPPPTSTPTIHTSHARAPHVPSIQFLQEPPSTNHTQTMGPIIVLVSLPPADVVDQTEEGGEDDGIVAKQVGDLGEREGGRRDAVQRRTFRGLQRLLLDVKDGLSKPIQYILQSIAQRSHVQPSR